MRVLVLLIAITASGLSSPAVAQGSARTLEERLKSIDPKASTDAHCASQIGEAETANAPELIYGGRVCEVVDKLVESSFLFAAGQVRAMSDVLLLPPATKSDDQSLMPLYTMLYFGGGMSGVKDEVLRDPAARERFLMLLDKWRPTYSPAYDPGWEARKRPDAVKYQATVAEAKADMRKHLDRAIHLVSDDQYYSLHRQYMQLLERHPDGIKAESPEGKLADDLQRRIRERMIALGVEVGPSPSELANAAIAENTMTEMRENFPPSVPEKDEVVLSASGDPTVARCLDLAERSAVSQGGKIVRVLITTNRKWGTIWRGDIAGGDEPPTRFTCTARTSSSSPLDIGDERIAPLPVKAENPQQ